MSTETAGFVRQISAVSPLDGDALDGSARPKPKRKASVRPTSRRGRKQNILLL